MADGFSINTALQRGLLYLYRKARHSALMRSPLGRRAFEQAYLAYKLLLEAGPIGRLRSYVVPGSCAIDVGANIGLFTTRFARWTGGGGLVIAIEPEAENFAALKRRLAKAGVARRVKAFQAVAAEAPGEFRLAVNPDHPGDHKLAADGVPVAGVSIDALMTENGNPPVSIIKIDTQGAEMRVLRGATATLARCRPALFIEVDDAALRNLGASADELAAFLAGYGYRPYALGRSRPLEPLGAKGLGRDRYQDVLFLPQEDAVTAP